MLWRHELKFLIDEAASRQLYYSLRPILFDDSHALGSDPDRFRRYQIRSLYFDDENRRGIFEKLAGTDPRHKYRIRIYNGQDQRISLEKKIKSGNLTQKHTCLLTRQQVESLLEGEPEFLLEASLRLNREAQNKSDRRAGQLLAEFYAEIRTCRLAPLLLVDYDRAPLLWPDGNVRITFDRHLSTGLYRQDLWDPDAGLVPVLDPDQVILEVKFDHFLPDFIRALLPLSGASQLSISKYAQCAGFCRTQSWEDQS
ncbi:MAG TPA: molecular chaperone [Clostridiales bacterium]|nr:molecular chaperone [Clostridiales bacterium]